MTLNQEPDNSHGSEKMNTPLPLIENDEIRMENLSPRNLNAWLIAGALMAGLGIISEATTTSSTLGIILIISSFIPTAISVTHWLEKRKTAAALSIVATDSGHPWHPSDEDGDSYTYILDVKGEWVQLPPRSRIQIVPDPILKGWTVRDEDEKLHARIGPISEDIVELLEEVVNQALILTRTLTEDEDPTLRDARQRENDAEGILERTWMDTTPGQVEIQFGQMGRAKEILGRRNRQFDSASDSEE